MITLSLSPVPRRALPGILSLRQGAGGPHASAGMPLPEGWSGKEMSLCIRDCVAPGRFLMKPPFSHHPRAPSGHEVPLYMIVAGHIPHGFPPAGAPFMGTDVTYGTGGLV